MPSPLKDDMKKPITPTEAKEKGFLPITVPYTPFERPMMERAIAQLGPKRDHALVIENSKEPTHLTVYARPS
jgi:hypothetical protein